MDLWLLWIVVGFVLVIAELVTGTFYLLVIGVGAFAAAAADWLGMNLLVQAVAGSAVALGGAWFVHHWHVAHQKDGKADNLLDRGQPVVLERWTNETAGIARVKYRGTTWDARLARPEAKPEPGTTLYIEGQEGSMLIVAAQPPAR